MEQYINKAALIAEIKKHQEIWDGMDGDYCKGQRLAYSDMLSFLDTLEVKEVDFEKEIENIIEKEKAFVTDNREVKYYNGDSFNHIYELEFIAKHFFELGTQKAMED